MQKVCVLFGPTASGKSSVAIALAHLLGGEVISADSMQLYRGLDIGTAKVTQKEMQGIPHHMIDILEPSQKFSVAEFKSQALLVIADILARGKTPVVCGGTGLYLDALLRNISFDETPQESPLRADLFAEHAQKGNAWMHAKLEALDPASASAIHANNVKRVIRALEVTLQTGISFSKQKQTAVELPSPYQFQLFGLVHKREVLYARIDTRVDLMFAQGLLE
ncbi:MAG: tRNA (adenosine(37)-N6)-dimethylallyltransferase MiaA, partial [Pseudomonadota bacterium]